jgi:hypothetical protein
MPYMYNKLFTSILDSSIWLEDDGVIRVWVTLLASMDEIGFCKFGSIHNLARRANKTPKETARCIEILESPDKIDPQQEYEGRRVERVEGGWMVLNAAKYRDMATRAIAIERNRIRVQNFRAKTKSAIETPRTSTKRTTPNASLGARPSTMTDEEAEQIRKKLATKKNGAAKNG